MPQGFTAPDGTFYTWNKPTPPTQADIDAIVAFHTRTHPPTNAAPLDPYASGGAIGVQPVAKPRTESPSANNQFLQTLKDFAKPRVIEAPNPVRDFQQAIGPDRLLDPKGYAAFQQKQAEDHGAKRIAAAEWFRSQAQKPLVPADFNGLPFTFQEFRTANDAGTAVQGRNGKPYELSDAMARITKATGKQNFALSASQSDIEQRPERQLAQQQAARAKNSMVGRFVDAQRSGDPRGAAATVGMGLVGSGVDKIFSGIGRAADVIDSGTVGAAIDRATRRDGGQLTPSEKNQLVSEFGRRALATAANAGGFLGLGADSAMATQAGHRILNAGFGLDLGLTGAKTSGIAADTYRSDDERTDAARELAINTAMMAVPAALAKIAHLIPEGTLHSAAEAVHQTV